VRGVKVLNARVASVPVAALMEMGDMIRSRMESGVAVLATVYQDKPYLLATATPDVVASGVHCGKLIKMVAEITGGSGGGKPDMAQAGAKNKDKIDEALKLVPEFVDSLLNSAHV